MKGRELISIESEMKLSWDAPLWWPLYCLTVSPDAISHRRAVWSDEAEIRIGLNEMKGWHPFIPELTGYQIGWICTERAVPDPALVTLKDLLLFKVVILRNGPDLNSCVRRAGGQISCNKTKKRFKVDNWGAMKPADFTSGLSNTRVKYFLCAPNLVTAWYRGRLDRSSLIFQT